MVYLLPQTRLLMFTIKECEQMTGHTKVPEPRRTQESQFWGVWRCCWPLPTVSESADCKIPLKGRAYALAQSPL